MPVRLIIGGIGLVALFIGLVFAMNLVGFLFAVSLEVPWVASITILVVFLIAILPTKGWTPTGTIIFMVAVGAGAVLDMPGNPYYNAPFEQLFLEEGEYLASRAIVEHPTQGETAVSGENIVVNATGEQVGEVNGFLTFGYRLVLYSVIYGVLLTIRGFFPEPRARSTTSSGSSAGGSGWDHGGSGSGSGPSGGGGSTTSINTNIQSPRLPNPKGQTTLNGEPM